MMSLPHPEQGLKGRKCIVMSSSDDNINKDVYTVVHSPEELWKELKNTKSYLDPVVIGGSAIYNLLLQHCTIIHVTKVRKAHPNPDRFFPNLDNDPNWQITYMSDTIIETTSDGEEIRYHKLVYKRTKDFQSKYGEVRTNYSEDDIVFVDAWLTNDDNEEGTVIAKINTKTKTVEFLDTDAASDPYALEEIQTVLNQS